MLYAVMSSSVSPLAFVFIEERKGGRGGGREGGGGGGRKRGLAD